VPDDLAAGLLDEPRRIGFQRMAIGKASGRAVVVQMKAMPTDDPLD
jgi:hypothetical protein